jgi:uncharacterized membrane protein
MTDDLKKPMSAVIFYHIAEYCYYCTVLTIKHKGKKVQEEWWSSEKNEITVKTKKFSTRKKAYRAYLKTLGTCVTGTYKIMNALPQKVTWKKDTK